MKGRLLLLVVVAVRAVAAGAAELAGAELAAFRQELRAFYPDECHDKCKSAEYEQSRKAICDEVTAWAEAHPGWEAIDVRRASYAAMRRHFRPFLFKGSPFYFEAGINGGWAMQNCPARIVNRICGWSAVERGLLPQSATEAKGERYRQHYALCCGDFVDDMHHVPAFHKIFTKGFRGVRDDVAAALAACPANDPVGRKELEVALEGLDTIHAIQLKFAEEAKKKVEGDEGEKEGMRGRKERERKNLLRIAESAARCPWEPPRNFYEGLNTLWFLREIPSYVDGLASYALGRPDAWLIDLYRRDIANGTLTEAEARDLVARWQIIADCHHDGTIPVDSYSDHEAEIPVTLGGCDAAGKPVWNELTRMFLSEHQRLGLVFPKLHVRFSKDSPQDYLETIGRMVIEGHCVFAMFNDDIAIPGFVGHGVPLARARDYSGCGCWDGNVDTVTDVDAANYVSPLKVLEAMIHRDPEAERRAQVRNDPIDDAKSFEEVKAIFMANTLRLYRALMSDYTRFGPAAARMFPHPAYSMCLDGCLERRRDTTDGGTAFRPRVMTIAFGANVVDSLCAIEKVCFVDKAATLKEFLAAVRSDWKGERGEELRLKAMSAPYWGDNTPKSNGLMAWLIDSVHGALDGMKNDNGGPYVLACWVYREFMYWGMDTKATPDGRHNGDRLSQGFAPSEFRCREQASSVINALSTLPHEKLYASNANLTFDKEGMTPELFASIFRVFAESRAHLLQPNCNSLEELLDAQVHPERHQELMVKVCGFSARFIHLSKRWQDEVIERHRLK